VWSLSLSLSLPLSLSLSLSFSLLSFAYFPTRLLARSIAGTGFAVIKFVGDFASKILDWFAY